MNTYVLYLRIPLFEPTEVQFSELGIDRTQSANKSRRKEQVESVQDIEQW